MSSSYAVRVTRPSSVLAPVYSKLTSVCGVVVVYEHPDEGNVHCHMYLGTCSVSTDTLKNYIKKAVGDVGRTEWSFKAGATPDFISYMSKGKYDPVYMSDISSDEISIYKAKGYDAKAVRLENGKLVKPVNAVLKKTKRELIEIMCSRVNVQASSVETIIKIVRKVLMEHGEVLGNYKCMDYVDALMMYGDKTRWVDNMTMLYNKRYGI